MLKSHLLANAGTDEVRKRLNALWKSRIDQLLQVDKEADADAIKSWLRARHAETIRERQAGASAQDFEKIGSEFHRWVRDSGRRIGLATASNFSSFVESDFSFYTNWYIQLQKCATNLIPGREAIYCNGLANFTLQLPLMLAPLAVTDSDEVAWQKILVVATFVDILIARRLWQGRSIDYNTMQYAMFLVMKDIRRRSALEIADILRARILDDTTSFSAANSFGLGQANKKVVRRFLARLTAWLDNQIGLGDHLISFLTSAGPQGYDIEHVIADQYSRFSEDFSSEEDFQEARNRIGALLLLPKRFNRSYGALPFEDKRQHYVTQNALAQTLSDQAYARNTGLQRVITELGIPFSSYLHFGRPEIIARQEIYARMAEAVWSLDRLTSEAVGSKG
jgi:hypothetical protein